jgi:hypothetical protein
MRESSFLINKNKIIRRKFAWQDEYFAVSVSEYAVSRVRQTYLRLDDLRCRQAGF